jgi:predicted acyltransferase
MNAAMTSTPPMAQREPRRFASVDVLRGLTIAGMIFVNNPGDWSHIFGPLGHAYWHGCSLTDLGFPTFLFIVGVSISLVGGPRLEAGGDVSALQRAWWWRALRIVLVGWALAALAVVMLPSPASTSVPWRPMGILPRIGICFGLVGWLYLHASWRGRWLVYGALLAVYGALLAWWGDLTPDHSLPSRVDAFLLRGFAYHYDPATGLGRDPEGLLSTLGALSNTLLGSLCGDWLRRRQVRHIALTGALLVLAGLLLHRAGWMPMNKNLWTPPFAAFAGGVSALALAVTHVLVEQRGWPLPGRRFGVNAITAYVGSIVLLCVLEGTPLHGWIYQGLFAPLSGALGPKLPSHLYALAQVGLWWLVMWWMDRRHIRLSL